MTVFTQARPLLGTVISLHIHGKVSRAAVSSAADPAWAILAHVGRVMSAHDPGSDLGRMSRARSHEVLTLDPHTVVVLAAAQYWTRRSRGAFNPGRAGQFLARRGVRPGLKAMTGEQPGLDEIDILSDCEVRMPAALCLDFGGIAKGYAVDQAVQCLMQQGIDDALVNAGGDIRVVGRRRWPVEVRHARHQLRDRVVKAPGRTLQAAMATSAWQTPDTDSVQTTGRGCRQWRSATVTAPDCMTADALTKWALQSSLLCPTLKSALREHHATLWRSE